MHSPRVKAHRYSKVLCDFSTSCLTFRKSSSARIPTANKKPSVLISGFGLAGLTCALSLKKFGDITPVILEKEVHGHTKEADHLGLFLHFNGVKVLKNLGVLDKVEKAGQKISKHLVTDKVGAIIKENSFKSDAESLGISPIGISSHDLFQILNNSFGGTVGYFLRKKHSLTSFEQIVDNHVLKVSCKIKGGLDKELFDVVVGADGSSSTVRSLLFGKPDKSSMEEMQRLQNSKITWYTIWDRPNSTPDDALIEQWGNAAYLSLVPLPNKKVFVWGSFKSIVPAAAFVQGVKGLTAVIKSYETFRGFGIPDLLDDMEKTETKKGCVVLFPFEQVHTAWHKKQVVLIGDAAHELSPVIHQGASQALQDAFTLGKLLANSDGRYEEAIGKYFISRFADIQRLQTISKSLNSDFEVADTRFPKFRKWNRERRIRNNVSKLDADAKKQMNEGI